jgi:hypothetical protein
MGSTGLFIAPMALTAPATVTVTATSTGGAMKSASAKLTVGPAISLAIPSATAVGGNPLPANRIRLAAPAPAGGVVVTLSSSNPAAASPPESVLIAAGATESAAFPIATGGVASVTAVVITAACSGGTASATVTVNPAALQSISMPASFAAGTTVTASVSLTGQAPPSGAILSLTSSAPEVASVPAQLTIPAGQTSGTFPIKALSSPNSATVQITAAFGDVSRAATVTVTPATVGLKSFTLAYETMTSGDPATNNRIFLAGPAPEGGATVVLSMTGPITGPAAVTVAPGATVAAFTLMPGAVDDPTPVSITATLGADSRTNTAKVNPAFVSSVSVPSPLTAGTSGKALVSLRGLAGAAGTIVSLVSSDPSVLTVPAQVTVPAGGYFARFSVTSGVVTEAAAVQVTATTREVSRTRTVNVVPVLLEALTLSGTSVTAGATLSGNRISLDGPATQGGVTVALSTSTPAITVPASVLVPAGETSTTFSLTAGNVDAATPVIVNASLGAVAKTATLNVVPALLSSVFMPAAFSGGTAGEGTIFLGTHAGPSGVTVTLTSSNPSVVAVPAQVVVPPGVNTASFAYTSVPVASAATLQIVAASGGVSRSVTFGVLPVTVSSVTFGAASFISGSTVTSNRIYLTGEAPAGGLLVALSASTPAITMARSVLVPAGAASVTFPVTVAAVDAPTPISLTATAGTTVRSASAMVTPAELLSVTIPSSLTGGGLFATGTIRLNGVAGPNGSTVALQSSNQGVLAVPAAVRVPAGGSSVLFSVTTGSVTSATAVSVVGRLGTVSSAGNTTVEPPALTSVTPPRM